MDKDLKRLVRSRMAATDENYTTARSALVPVIPGVDLRVLVSKLADPATALAAAAALRPQPPERLVSALVAGLRSPEWRVRRSCCRLLDDLDFTPESLAALQRALDDQDPRVRRSALHTLSCQQCKPSGCAIESQPLFERMVRDPNRRVRDAVLNPLGWQRPGPWAEPLVEYMAANDPSEKLRANARGILARLALERSADAERRRLPERLRLKTERHPFQWVALDGDRFVASRSKALNWELRRWLQAGDVTAVSESGLRWYFVMPD
ncbi:MAG TPA: HEAT repeat domain-containing protein [Myxococcaceae bacterium]|nr:HEAT repeat domain-containing protein [Myxococcaceae bacterium]